MQSFLTFNIGIVSLCKWQLLGRPLIKEQHHLNNKADRHRVGQSVGQSDFSIFKLLENARKDDGRTDRPTNRYSDL